MSGHTKREGLAKWSHMAGGMRAAVLGWDEWEGDGRNPPFSTLCDMNEQCKNAHNTATHAGTHIYVYKIKKRKHINFILLNLGGFPWILHSIFSLFTEIFK
jgi:hypothetical protein